MTLSTYCQILGINKYNLLSRSRKHKLVLYRQIYCYLLWTSGEYELRDISDIILLHHATILYSVEKIKDYISINNKETVKILDMVRDYKIKRLESEGYSLKWLDKNVRATKGDESYHGKLSKVFKDIFGYA